MGDSISPNVFHVLALIGDVGIELKRRFLLRPSTQLSRFGYLILDADNNVIPICILNRLVLAFVFQLDAQFLCYRPETVLCDTHQMKYSGCIALSR
jgi:hypothetical protein